MLEGADGRLEIARVGTEHGTNAQDGESKDTEIGTSTQHGSLAYANKNGERGDGSLEIARVGIEHGPKTQDGKSEGTQIGRVGLRRGPEEPLCGLREIHLVCLRPHGWKYRTSRMRCLF